jgi:hypothetical protein
MSTETMSKPQKNKAFYQTSFFKHSLSFFCGALMLYSVQLLSDFAPGYTIANSERISWTEAVSLKNEYLGFKPLMVRHARTEGVPNDTVESKLQGFVFDAKQIDSIINHNVLLPQGQQADEVIIYFGQKGSYRSWFLGKKRPRLHIVTAGIKGGDLLINKQYPSDKLKANVYDKADPCPPHCPK